MDYKKEERIYLVYKHTNKVNGKVYVGQTCLKPEDRWLNGKGYKGSTHFNNAIQKYGWDNFEHKILIHGLTKNQADMWEKKLIQYWHSMDNKYGYNLREGGSNGKHSKESKLKQSIIMKNKYKNGEITSWNKGKKCPQLSGKNNPNYGKHHTEEAKQKISEKNSGKNSSWYGKHHTNETIQKIREANIGYKNPMFGKTGDKHHSSKKVISIKNNKIYNCTRECAEDNNCSQSYVVNNCNKKFKIQKFMYYDEWLKL